MPLKFGSSVHPPCTKTEDIYMLKRVVLFFIFILFIQTATAQNGALSINIEKASKTDARIILNFVPGANLQEGFAVQLPEGMKAAILAISSNGRLLWIKQSAEKPNSPNAVHWHKIQNGYILRLLPENLTAGRQIEIKLQSPVIKNQKGNRRITLL